MANHVRNPGEKPRKWDTFIVIAVFAVAFLLRLRGLGSSDFWYDEMFSVFYAKNPWGNWNAPLYWILLHFWTKLFGFSEFSLRLPGMLFNFSTVLVVFLIGKSIFNRKTALLAACFIGLSSFHIWYAQDARDYSMFLFFGTLSSYLLLLALNKGGRGRWALFIASSCIAVYTNYFTVFLIAAQVLYLLIVKRVRPNKGWWFFLLIPVIFSFYLPRFASKFKFVAEGFWIPNPSWKTFNIILQNYMLGYNGTFFLYTLSSFIILALFVFLFVAAGRKINIRGGVYFCCFLLFIPLVLPFLFSKLLFSIYLNRCFILFSPYFYLLLAQAVMELNRAMKPVAAAVLIIIFGCGAYLYSQKYMYPLEVYHPGAHFTKPVKPLSEFIDGNIREGDIVAFTGRTLMLGVKFYCETQFTPYLFFDQDIWVLKNTRPRKEGRYCVPLHKIKNVPFNRVWLVLLNREVNRGLDRNAISVKAWFDKNMKLVSEDEFENSWVYCYERTSP